MRRAWPLQTACAARRPWIRHRPWLARRIVRQAGLSAWRRWREGLLLDQVELPLYTTCARIAAASGDSIRRAMVSSALGLLPDLGGARVVDALRALFEERNAPTLLVADSLDEAGGADDRIRMADTLPYGWRIIVTSRPCGVSSSSSVTTTRRGKWDTCGHCLIRRTLNLSSSAGSPDGRNRPPA